MKKVFVAGHRGMVGSAIVRQLEKDSGISLVLKTSTELDLTNQQETREFFESEAIDEVYLAAAKVGGIVANDTYPGQFIYDNLMIECNVINSSYINGVKNLLFLGSSCIYPRLAEQPIKETELLTGTLEPTNEPYAIAKIAGIKLCESYNREYGVDYRSVMPTNIYGPNDNFHPENSHVVPALLRRFHNAVINNEPEVVVWGSGKPMREFLHVDDLATASVHVMGLDKQCYDSKSTPMLSHINVGSGVDCTILELVNSISEVVGYSGKIVFDNSKPDGAPRKLMDVERARSLGWENRIALNEGLASTYLWYTENIESTRS